MIISGDTASGDAYLALQDGLLKRATSNVVDASNSSFDAVIGSSVIKAMPTAFRRDKRNMRFYVSQNVEQDYRLKLSTRGNGLGDQVLTGMQQVPIFGIPMVGVSLMSDARAILTNLPFSMKRVLLL